MKSLLSVIFFILSAAVQGQVIYTDPVFPVQDGTVTIYFDATQGNGALADVPAPIFAHTGVVTNESATETSWLHVQGVWGTYDEEVLMTEVADNLYSITYNINDFYGVPAGDTVFRLAFVFRNTDGSIVGRNADGSDIFTDVYLPGLNVAILTPNISPFIIDQLEEVNIQVASLDADYTDLYIDGVLVAGTTDDDLSYAYATDLPGTHWVKVVAGDATEELADSTSIYATRNKLHRRSNSYPGFICTI
jgi:hypothetical protein